MTVQIAEVSIVIVGDNIAVGQFDQRWMLKNGILSDSDEQPGFYTPFAVQQRTSSYELVVMPNRVQIGALALGDYSHLKDACAGIVAGCSAVLKASDTMLPASAIGINFAFVVFDEKDHSDYKALNDSLLAAKSPLKDLFNAADARFGIHAKQNFQNSLVALDMQAIQRVDAPGEGYQTRLNFHRDVKSKDEVKDHVQNIERFREFSEKAVIAIEKYT